MTLQTINIGTVPDDGTGDDLRLSFDKTNQAIAQVNALTNQPIPETAWTRVEGNYTVTKAYDWVDVFPNADNRIIKLPDPAVIGSKIRVDVYNQTNQGFTVLLHDNLDNLLKEILPAKSFSAFWEVDHWELVQTSGLAVPALDPLIYGNFDSANWSVLPTAIYSMSALGSQLSGFPPDYVFNPVSTYNFQINFVNETGVTFGQAVAFATDSDFSNPNVGRTLNRIGIDLGSMITTGWRVYVYKGEPLQTEKLTITDTSDNTRGELTSDANYGLTIVGRDDSGNLSPLVAGGSTFLVSAQQFAAQFSGAANGNFLRVLDKTEINGEDYFVISTTPLDVVEYSETFQDATDYLLSTSYVDIVQGNVANQYRAETSSAQAAAIITNASNASVEIEYYVSVNDAAPTPDDLQTATVPRRDSGVDGRFDISFADTSQTAVEIGNKVSLKVRLKAGGSSVSAKGTIQPSSILIEQTASIVNVGQSVNELGTDSTLDSSSYYRLTGGNTFDLPAASSVFNASTPYGMYIKNVSGSNIEIVPNGADTIYTIDGEVSSITIQDGENYNLVVGDSTTWDVTGSYLKQSEASLYSCTMRRINVFDNTAAPVISVAGTNTQNIVPPADDTGSLNGFVEIPAFTQGSAPAALNGWSIVNGRMVAGPGTTGIYQAGGSAQFFHQTNNSAVAFVIGQTKSDNITYFTPSASISTMPNSDQIGIVAGEGPLFISEGDEISLWVASENTDPQLGIPNASLTVYRLNPAKTPVG